MKAKRMAFCPTKGRKLINASNTVLFLVVLSSLVTAIGKRGEAKVVSKVGGGACVTEQDCNANGPCEEEEGGKKKCSCHIKFKGPNCGVQAKLEPNVKPVPPVLKNDKTIVIKDQPARKSQVRQQIFHHASSKSSSGSKRHLGYDPGSNVAGIDPLTLADANQPFLIYSPKTELYLFMSNDKRVLGKKHNTYVEARSERFGGRNEFIIEKSRTGKFYIRNIKTDRYVYVSSSTSGVLKWSSFNVLGSDEYPGSLSDSNQKKKFEFVFEDDDDGFYRIKNNGNYLFVSSDRVGIPANRIVEADVKNRKRDQTQLFQFSLKEKATVEFKPMDSELEKRNVVTEVVSATRRYDNSNKDAEPFEGTYVFEKTYTSTITFSDTQGFTIKGDLSAILPIAGVNIQYNANFQTTNTESVTEKFSDTFKIVTKGGKISCATVTIDRYEYSQGFELIAKTKEGKHIAAKGKVHGTKHHNARVRVDSMDFTDNAKCSFEKVL